MAPRHHLSGEKKGNFGYTRTLVGPRHCTNNVRDIDKRAIFLSFFFFSFDGLQKKRGHWCTFTCPTSIVHWVQVSIGNSENFKKKNKKESELAGIEGARTTWFTMDVDDGRSQELSFCLFRERGCQSHCIFCDHASGQRKYNMVSNTTIVMDQLQCRAFLTNG